MLYNVVINYLCDGSDDLHTLTYSSQNRADCEYKAIRFITQGPLVKVISITFKEEIL